MRDRHLRRRSIRSCISHSTPETIAKNIHRSDIPYPSSSSPVWNVPVIQTFLGSTLLREFVVNAPLEIVTPTLEAPEPVLAAAVERLIEDDEGLTQITLTLLYGNDSPDEWATMSRTLERMPAWDSGYVADAGEEDEADTSITTASDLLFFFQPLHASSLSRPRCLRCSFRPGEILPMWNAPGRLRWLVQSAYDGNEQRS